MTYNGYIYLPPKGHRAGARQLAKVSKLQTIANEKGTPAKIKENACVINWGNSVVPRRIQPYPKYFLNKPECVMVATDKINTFQRLAEHNVPMPEFTRDEKIAENWYNDGYVVYSRTLAGASQGRGIIIQNPQNVSMRWLEISNAKFHTRRFRGKIEYRVHIFMGKVIDIQQKRRRRDCDLDDTHFIKNYSNGYIFAREDIDCPEVVIHAAGAAISALGLDFGAVDVAYAPTIDVPCVYEVNTRPSLTGTTLLTYSKVFTNFMRI